VKYRIIVMPILRQKKGLSNEKRAFSCQIQAIGKHRDYGIETRSEEVGNLLLQCRPVLPCPI